MLNPIPIPPSPQGPGPAGVTPGPVPAAGGGSGDEFGRALNAPAADGPSAVSNTEATGGFLGPFQQLERIPARMQELNKGYEELAKLDPADKGYRVLSAKLDRDMMGLQMDVNGLAFRAELAAKLVEHATSGTRTVLQTQA